MTIPEKMRGVLGRSLVASKELAAKGALRVGCAHMKSRIERLHSKLGYEVYFQLVDMGNATISRSNLFVNDTLDEIKSLHSRPNAPRPNILAANSADASRSRIPA